MSTFSDPSAQSAEAFGDKVFTAALGAMETLSLYLGERVGWFAALADAGQEGGALTAAELAARTHTHERYALEWLEMQAVYGNLLVSDHEGRHERRYRLSPAAAEVLTDEHSLAYLGALPRMIASVGGQLDNLATVYRQGGGVSWAELGDDARSAQAALNRPWFESALAPALAGVSDLHQLLSTPDARIADVGCGAGWSTIALARAYPQAHVVGFDVDEPSVDLARANAEAVGLTERVQFRLAEGESVAQEGSFDAAFAFECLHDMAQPVEVLSSIRRAVRPDGAVVIMDEAVADSFTAPGNVVEQAMYGYSTLICLPDGLSSTPSVGTGTVLRRSILTEYAYAAGFDSVEILPITDFGFFRFYRLRAGLREDRVS